MNQEELEAQLQGVKQWDRGKMGELASLSRLRLWKFADGAQFEANTFGELSRLKILQFLAFENSELEGDNLRSLPRLPLLRRLDLKGCRFAADDFAFLCEQWAQGACPKLSEVWLAGASVGDDELRALGRIERLRWLILDDTAISDAGLESLHTIPKLETLWLRNTPVTDEGVLGLAVLPRLSIVVLSDPERSKDIRARLFEAQVALKKSKKSVNQTQVEAASLRLHAFLGEMEAWELSAYERAQDIEKRHKAARPQSNVMSDAEAEENDVFWSDINEQKSVLAARFCSQKLLERGAGNAGSYGNPPHFEQQKEWIDVETPSKKRTIFYGEGRMQEKRRYIMVLEEGEWKLDEVQWWSGGWKRDIV